jgi:hypothetical protein
VPGHKLNNPTLINDFLAACVLLSVFPTTVCFIIFENILRMNYWIDVACKFAGKPLASCECEILQAFCVLGKVKIVPVHAMKAYEAVEV